MKIKTALLTICILLFCSIFPLNMYAQEFDVDVSANINVDLYSQVQLLPSTVEIEEDSQVIVRRLDTQGDPLSGRSLEIYIDGDDTGITIGQPDVTDSFGETNGSVSSSQTGTYEVCVKDVTESNDIYIDDCESLFVVPVPVPVMNPEPQYTKGTSNSVMWSHSGSNTYDFQVQLSTDSSFNNVLRTSDWISSLTYEFNNLNNGQIYFYRTRARNQFGGISNWSGYVYSIQDSSKPVITLLSVGDIGDNTVEEWDNSFVVPFSFRIEDNVGVASKDFSCVLRDGSLDDCSENPSSSGEIWNLEVSLSDLEKDSNYDLYEEYNFCVEASDTVGNVTRFCDVYLEFPHKEDEGGDDEPVVPVPPVVEKTKDTVEEIIDDIVEVVDNTIGKLDSDELQTVTVTTTTATVTVGIGALIASAGYLPYVLLEVFLSILSFFGFRKKGNPVGYVYNSITKEPISQAIVRIFDTNHSLVWTDVTDSNGYFNASDFDEGEYSISVHARNFDFPSKIVFGREDFPLENVYHGHEFIAVNGKVPNFSIPLDPLEVSESRKSLERVFSSLKFVWKILHLLLFVFGFVFSLYALYTTKLWWNYIVIGLYVPSFVLLTRDLFGRREKWGVVRDVSGKKLEGIIIGLKEKEFDKLVSKRVTDEDGKYRFIVERGRYVLVVLNPGFKFKDRLEDVVVSVVDGVNNVIGLDLVVEGIQKEEIVKEESKKKVVVEEDVLEPLEAL